MITVRRHPAAGLAAVLTFVALYWFLCKPIATQRGNPPLQDVYYEYLVPYIWLLAPPLIPLLDDRLKQRRIDRSVLIIGVCLGLGAVWANAMSAVPARFPSLPHVLNTALYAAALVVPYVIYCERVFMAVWNRVRQFSESKRSNANKPSAPYQ